MISPYPHIINNFFNEEEFLFIKQYMLDLIKNKEYVFMKDVSDRLETKDKWVVNHHVGRINFIIPKNKMPKEILDCITRESKKINPNSNLEFVEIVRYSSLYGIPGIDPHIDPPSKRCFMFNIQIDSNIQWSLMEYVGQDAIEIPLKNNSCAVMDVSRVIHWRKPILFQDGDYVDMLFMHFVDENTVPVDSSHYPHPPYWKNDAAYKYTTAYNLEMLKNYPQKKDINLDDLADIVKKRVSEIGSLYPNL